MSRAVQKLKKWVPHVTRDRGTKTEIIIVTNGVKVNSEDDKFSKTCCKHSGINQFCESSVSRLKTFLLSVGAGLLPKLFRLTIKTHEREGGNVTLEL